MSKLEYTENDRRNDFRFLNENLNKLYSQYGKCFLAIRNGEIIGSASTAKELLDSLSHEYQYGTYSIQECNGSATANQVRIQRMTIGA